MTDRQLGGILQKQERKFKALCALSNVDDKVNLQSLNSYVKGAPDPETAVRAILDTVPATSEVLTRKWRGAITELWESHHPLVPMLPGLSLTTGDVKKSPFLKDANAMLAAIEKAPIKVVQEGREWQLAPDEVARLATLLPSYAKTPVFAVENEWAMVPLRRLRAVLQSLRLVRLWRGELRVVRSRLERFRMLPKTQQYYILWHADAYHIDWSDFAGLWGKYMKIIQEYMPLLWESIGSPVEGEVSQRVRWCVDVLEAFIPLWDDEGLLTVRRGSEMALTVVQHHALPTIVDRFLLRDLFTRHGLVTLSAELEHITQFTWTRAGQAIVQAEATLELPCGFDLIEGNKAH